MALLDIINRALDLAAAAFDFFFESALGHSSNIDRWVTTSGNPCLFCRHMAMLSAMVDVPEGHPFPVPNYSILVYASAHQISQIDEPPAHENCQCIRQTITRP